MIITCQRKSKDPVTARIPPNVRTVFFSNGVDKKNIPDENKLLAQITKNHLPGDACQAFVLLLTIYTKVDAARLLAFAVKQLNLPCADILQIAAFMGRVDILSAMEKTFTDAPLFNTVAAKHKTSFFNWSKPKTLQTLLCEKQYRVFRITAANGHTKVLAWIAEKARFMKCNNSVVRLNLKHNRISDVGAKLLADILEHNHTLRDLNLCGRRSDNIHIGETGAMALARALENNDTLTHLDLGSNKITDKGARAILDALQHNHSLQHIELAGNEIQTDKLLNDIHEKLAKNRLNCSSHQLSSEGFYNKPVENGGSEVAAHTTAYDTRLVGVIQDL